jgi:hypothetical protein
MAGALADVELPHPGAGDRARSPVWQRGASGRREGQDALQGRLQHEVPLVHGTCHPR